MLIFELSQPQRKATAQMAVPKTEQVALPTSALRQTPPRWPCCSELQVVRHYTTLSQKNFAIDTQFYPLGSCTMKYNPRGVHHAAMLPGFSRRHPLADPSMSQGFLQALFELQGFLSQLTGLPGVSLTPMAGSQGELAGITMIKAYHQSRGDSLRNEMLIPDAAHGTNPATSSMCDYKVIEIPTGKTGEIDLNVLRQLVGNKTAGMMLTNPSTLGLFMSNIKEVAEIVHQAGGLLYYDGANFNAIVGKVRPGDMGFDVMHLNLHKTFATPHGGGGPGSGPIAVSKRLLPYLPTPSVIKTETGFAWSTQEKSPQSIGRLSCFMGNAGILLRAYFYILMLGQKGLNRVSQYATLNANYLLAELRKAGFQEAYPGRRATHEFLITLQEEKKRTGVSAMDFAKRLLDFRIHAPTTYFPLLVPECWLIEPTETEAKETLDHFVQIMRVLREEAHSEPEKLKNAPHHLPVKRLDDVKAARELDLNYFQAARTPSQQ